MTIYKSAITGKEIDVSNKPLDLYDIIQVSDTRLLNLSEFEAEFKHVSSSVKSFAEEKKETPKEMQDTNEKAIEILSNLPKEKK